MHKFEIGQIVYHRAGLDEARWGRIPVAYCIIEKLTQVCHGGTQYLYQIRRDDRVFHATDAELVAADDPAVAKAIEEKLGVGWFGATDKALKMLREAEKKAEAPSR